MRARWQFCVPAGDFCGNGFLSTNCTNFTNEFYADKADLSKFHEFFVGVLFSVLAEELGGLTAEISALGSSGEKNLRQARRNVFLVLRVAGTHYKMNDYDFVFDFKFFSASV